VRMRRIVYLSFAVLLLAGLLPLAATAQPAPAPEGASIEPELLARLEAEGTASFFVKMAVEADLSAAYGMDWLARGEYVWNTLAEVARASQAPVLDYCQANGLECTSFRTTNSVYVGGGALAAAQDLAALPGVAYLRLERVWPVEPVAGDPAPAASPVPDVAAKAAPQYTKAWGLVDTNADDVWALGYKGAGLKVAGIDTGVQWNHPALDQAFACGTNPSDPKCWADPGNVCGGSACDNNGHGTHTMGTMVGDDDPSLTYWVGMAPDAKWIACKGCASNSCADADLNACADWLLQPGGNTANRPNVVNNSWGGTPDGDPWYQAKVVAWRAAGIFPAFSAGNSGSGCDTMGDPGSYQESFASAAHDSGRTIASFSSRGPSAFGHDPYTKPNLSAPGVAICSSVPTNGWDCTYQGTSMASPHNAGAVALIWQACPAYKSNIDATFQLLQNHTDAAPAGNCGTPPDGQGNYTYGYGYLNVLKAVQACYVSIPKPYRAYLPLVMKNYTPGGGSYGLPISQGFESGIVPPAGWTRIQTNPRQTWKIHTSKPYAGTYSAEVQWDDQLAWQDELLLSPEFAASTAQLQFASFGSPYWCRDTFDNCDLDVWLVRGGWGGGDDTWVYNADGSWPGTFVWGVSNVNLTPYLTPGQPVQVAFRYTGLDGAQVALDAISITGSK
jgi:subtilisin family serine protease